MKIKNITSTELFKLKLAVVTFHNGEQNAYLRESIAGDACYSSNNSLEFKENQMSDQRAKIASLTPCEGQEVVDKKLAFAVDIYRKMELELAELTVRFETDKEVYKAVTDEDWKPRAKTSKQDVSQILNEAAAILGKNYKPIQETI